MSIATFPAISGPCIKLAQSYDNSCVHKHSSGDVGARFRAPFRFCAKGKKSTLTALYCIGTMYCVVLYCIALCCVVSYYLTVAGPTHNNNNNNYHYYTTITATIIPLLLLPSISIQQYCTTDRQATKKFFVCAALLIHFCV